MQVICNKCEKTSDVPAGAPGGSHNCSQCGAFLPEAPHSASGHSTALGLIGGGILGGAIGGPLGAIIGGILGALFGSAQDSGDLDDREETRAARQKKNKVRKKGGNMAEKKVVFVAFAIEDERQRDFLKGQTLVDACPFEYIDMSVKDPYDADWKDRVRTRIRRSDGVIALVSKNSLTSSGQKWEISCAKEEQKKILAIWAYTDDKTTLAGVNTVAWTWDAIKAFIDKL